MSRVSRAIVVVGALLAGTATASASNAPTQLDRIEHKLDLILHRLDQLQAGQAAGARPAPSPAAAKPAAAPAGTAGPTPAPETMAAGAVAIVHAAPANPVSARQIPTDSVGGFIYTGGTLQLADLSNRGVRFAGLTGVEWQGWLRTTETGRYELELDGSTVSVNNFTNATCIFSGWLEDRPIGVQQATPSSGIARPAPFSLVLGAALSPGLYKLRLWAACTPSVPNARVSVTLLEKAPSDLNMRPITGEDLVHKQGADHASASSG